MISFDLGEIHCADEWKTKKSIKNMNLFGSSMMLLNQLAFLGALLTMFKKTIKALKFNKRNLGKFSLPITGQTLKLLKSA